MTYLCVPMITALVMFVLRRSHNAMDAPTIATELENYYRLEDIKTVLRVLHETNLIRVFQKAGSEWHVLTVPGNMIAYLIMFQPDCWEDRVMDELRVAVPNDSLSEVERLEALLAEHELSA